jgi:hypothetical protein
MLMKKELLMMMLMTKCAGTRTVLLVFAIWASLAALFFFLARHLFLKKLPLLHIKKSMFPFSILFLLKDLNFCHFVFHRFSVMMRNMQ